MGEDIVYSTLCALDGAPPHQLDEAIAMARLWAAHVRGPGAYDGRLLILTNVPDLTVEGSETQLAPFRVRTRQDLFLERVRQFTALPLRPRDNVMQLDLDALVIAPLARVFAAIQPGALMAATSGLSPLHHDQAGCVMTRAERWRYRVRGWYRRPGVSACVTACRGADWPGLMREWCQTIDERGRERPMPRLGDQSFLNALFLAGPARVRRLPRRLIYHLREPGLPTSHPEANQATILHFPLPNKLAEMQRWSQRATPETASAPPVFDGA